MPSRETHKSIDGLMRHLRNRHNINISGSTQKRQLRNIGYFHGFKGYRFIGVPSNQIIFSDFKEVMALNKFDTDLKALFYEQIMFIETALKNYVAEILMDECGCSDFTKIYNELLTAHRAYPVGSDIYQRKYIYRCRVRDDVYKTLSLNYVDKSVPIVRHYYHTNRQVPIWAIFEIMSMGKFGAFVKCLNNSTKLKIIDNLGLNKSGIRMSSKNLLITDVIFSLTALRNAIAHNRIVFDVKRFSEPSAIRKDYKRCIIADTGVQQINFKNVIDYFISIIYILRCLAVKKTELNRLVRNFEKIVKIFRRNFQLQEIEKIIHPNTNQKLLELRDYIKNS